MRLLGVSEPAQTFKVLKNFPSVVCTPYWHWLSNINRRSVHILVSNVSCFLHTQLVYKVKLDAIGGKLACHLYGQQDLTRWSDLIEEAKSNLMKITVIISALLLLCS